MTPPTTLTSKRLALVLLAGGQGSRFQASASNSNALSQHEHNKLLTPLHGQPCLYWALAGCLASIQQTTSVQLSSVVCVAPKAWQPLYAEVLTPLLSPLATHTPISWVEGGNERYDSVYHALQQLERWNATTPTPPTDWVMIHDAARPVVPQQAVIQLLHTLTASVEPLFHGGSVGTPCSDTIKRIHPPAGDASVMSIACNADRHELMAVQTPQCFQWDALWQAHQRYQTWAMHTPHPRPSVTDDCHLLEQCLPQAKVCIQPAPASNIKLTQASDVRLAEALLATCLFL